jgi:hypothetical protein
MVLLWGNRRRRNSLSQWYNTMLVSLEPVLRKNTKARESQIARMFHEAAIIALGRKYVNITCSITQDEIPIAALTMCNTPEREVQASYNNPSASGCGAKTKLINF